MSVAMASTTAADPTVEMLELNDAALAARAAGASDRHGAPIGGSPTVDGPPQYTHVMSTGEKSDVGGSMSGANVMDDEPTWLREAGVMVSVGSTTSEYV